MRLLTLIPSGVYALRKRYTENGVENTGLRNAAGTTVINHWLRQWNKTAP
jgi:hypothetical protein